MVTYESLKELAHALSKITGYRYIAFCESYNGDLFVNFSNSKMMWHSLESHGFWAYELDHQLLDLGDLPFLDWSKCQFDCKEEEEKDMDINFYNGKPFEYHGTHSEVDYWIVSRGYHPLAYVKLNQIESKTFFNEYECHGEITFRGKKEFEEGFEYVIGWDYAHFILNDYTIYLDKTEKDEENLKRWTFDEVEKEVFDFIDKYRIKKEA